MSARVQGPPRGKPGTTLNTVLALYLQVRGAPVLWAVTPLKCRDSPLGFFCCAPEQLLEEGIRNPELSPLHF